MRKQELLDGLARERERLLSAVEDLTATDAIPWPDENRPLWQFIGHDTFLHEWPAHAEQIERAAART